MLGLGLHFRTELLNSKRNRQWGCHYLITATAPHCSRIWVLTPFLSILPTLSSKTVVWPLSTQLLASLVPESRQEASVYLVLAVLQIHGAGPVGDLIGLVLLMGLQGDELWPLPVLALKDGVQIPGLVGTV